MARTEVPSSCVAMTFCGVGATPPRVGSTPRMRDMAVSQEATGGEKLVHSAMHTLCIPPTLASGKAGKQISWGGEGIHACEYPDSHLWVKVSKQRGPAKPDRPCRSTRKEKDLVAILALVFADTL